MPIPLYFAIHEKDSVSKPKFHAAQCGFGFFADGTLRLPVSILPDALAVIDDSILPQKPPSEEAFRKLALCCQFGCLFDFEQTPTPMHTMLIQKLAQHSASQILFAAPEAFRHPRLLPLISQPKEPCSWLDFLRKTQEKHPHGWMLEVIPHTHTATLPFAKNQSGYIADSVCLYRQNGRRVQYYESRQTVRKKLSLAEDYGCRAAIGLYRELMRLPNESR